METTAARGRGRLLGAESSHPAFVHCAVSSTFTSALQMGMGGMQDSIMVWIWDTSYRLKAWSLVPAVIRGVAFRTRLDHKGSHLVPGWIHCHSDNPAALLGGGGAMKQTAFFFHALLSGLCFITGLEDGANWPWTGSTEIRSQNVSSLKLLSGICHNDKTMSNMNKYDGKFCDKKYSWICFCFPRQGLTM